VRGVGSLRVLVDVIADRLRDPEDGILARSILGTDDPHAIAAQVETFVPGVTGCALFTQSVGSVFVLERAGEKVVLKVHRFGQGLRDFEHVREIEAVYTAQAALAEAGVPCARVLEPPRPFSPGRVAALMSYLDPGLPDDPHTTGRVLAAEAARVASLLAAHELPSRARMPESLFPPAHNALFDLHREGGQWIDARATRARAVLDRAALPAAMHSDFSCANVRVVGGTVAAIYDMDSACVVDEARVVASMAVHFTYAGDPPWTWPTRDEACAFVAAYEAARGTPLDRERLSAAAIYAMAYTARCEHGHSGAGPMCEALRAAPDRYFD
jgi:hypothetical protein